MRMTVVALLSSCLCSTAALGVTINIDFGEAGGEPASSYGGAGLPGVWNNLRGDHGVTYFNLLDTSGNPTTASVRQVGGLQTLSHNDPGTAGADDALLDDFVVTYSATLESCLFFNGLPNGEYEVLLYAWMPNRPDIKAYTSVDEEVGFPHLIVGGAWAGAHQELVTYSRHIAVVTLGKIMAHSGIVPGASPAEGAPLCAVQLRLLSDCAPDLNGDGQVGAPDLALLLGSWGAAGGPADLDSSGTVGSGDLATLLGAWGPCST